MRRMIALGLLSLAPGCGEAPPEAKYSIDCYEVTCYDADNITQDDSGITCTWNCATFNNGEDGPQSGKIILGFAKPGFDDEACFELMWSISGLEPCP